MSSEFEEILRRVESEHPDNTRYKRGVAIVRAAVWTARRDELFPEHVTLQDRPMIYIHPGFEFHQEMGTL